MSNKSTQSTLVCWNQWVDSSLLLTDNKKTNPIQISTIDALDVKFFCVLLFVNIGKREGQKNFVEKKNIATSLFRGCEVAVFWSALASSTRPLRPKKSLASLNTLCSVSTVESLTGKLYLNERLPKEPSSWSYGDLCNLLVWSLVYLDRATYLQRTRERSLELKPWRGLHPPNPEVGVQVKETRKSTNRLAQVTKAAAMLDSGSVTKDKSSPRLTTSYFSKHLKVSGYTYVLIHTEKNGCIHIWWHLLTDHALCIPQFFLDRQPLNGRSSPIWKFHFATVASQMPVCLVISED